MHCDHLTYMELMHRVLGTKFEDKVISNIIEHSSPGQNEYATKESSLMVVDIYTSSTKVMICSSVLTIVMPQNVQM